MVPRVDEPLERLAGGQGDVDAVRVAVGAQGQEVVVVAGGGGGDDGGQDQDKGPQGGEKKRHLGSSFFSRRKMSRRQARFCFSFPSGLIRQSRILRFFFFFSCGTLFFSFNSLGTTIAERRGRRIPFPSSSFFLLSLCCWPNNSLLSIRHTHTHA